MVVDISELFEHTILKEKGGQVWTLEALLSYTHLSQFALRDEGQKSEYKDEY